jgi:hypothetical protein
MLQSAPAAGAPLPRSLRAPFLRFGGKRSLAAAKVSFTNVLLPITAPSVKYLTRQPEKFSCIRFLIPASVSFYLAQCGEMAASAAVLAIQADSEIMFMRLIERQRVPCCVRHRLKSQWNWMGRWAVDRIESNRLTGELLHRLCSSGERGRI